MKIDPTWDSARKRLFDLIVDKGVKLAGLSRAIGRNAAYIQQYLYRGSPAYLQEQDRIKLANYFNVSSGDFSVSRGSPTMEPSALDARVMNAAIIATLIALTESGRSLDDFSPEDIARAILRTYSGLVASRVTG